jgi:hypothetical protein
MKTEKEQIDEKEIEPHGEALGAVKHTPMMAHYLRMTF